MALARRLLIQCAIIISAADSQEGNEVKPQRKQTTKGGRKKNKRRRRPRAEANGRRLGIRKWLRGPRAPMKGEWPGRPVTGY